jgi:hypothetical protein
VAADAEVAITTAFVSDRWAESEENRSRFARWPTEAHSTSEAGGTPIGDDESIAKMGHSDLDLGHVLGNNQSSLVMLDFRAMTTTGDDIPIKISFSSVIDAQRLHFYGDKDSAESEAIEFMIKQIALEHGGNYEKSATVPRATKRDLHAIGREITYFHQQFEFLMAASGLSAILHQLKQPVEKWLQNRQGRTARVKIGDVEVELTGEGIEKAVAVAEKLAAKREGKKIIES